MSRALALAVAGPLVATPVLAAGDAGGDATRTLIYSALNFALLIAALVYFARKPIVAFFAERRDRIRQDLDSAAALLSEAEARHATWQRQLTDVQREGEQIRTAAEARAQAESERILAAARAAAARIRDDARVAVDQELERARAQLRLEALDLAVQIAEQCLREETDDRDRQRLVDEFIERVDSDARASR